MNGNQGIVPTVDLATNNGVAYPVMNGNNGGFFGGTLGLFSRDVNNDIINLICHYFCFVFHKLISFPYNENRKTAPNFTERNVDHGNHEGTERKDPEREQRRRSESPAGR